MKFLLQTPRLLLRELTADDLDFVTTMLLDEEEMRFYPQRYTPDDARAWLLRQQDRYQRDGHAFWLVVERTTSEPLGQVGLLRQLIEGEWIYEIGYLIHRPFWRRGFASEAAAGVRDHAFFQFDLSVVGSLIRPMNHPSRGVARKLGMRPIKLTLFAGLEHLLYRVERARPTEEG